MYKGLILFLCIVLLACSHRGESQSELAADRVGNYKITLSSGGGFTGLYRGYHLYGDGRVEGWEQRVGKGDSLLWQRSVEVAWVERLHDGLLASGALDMRYNKAGNMTAVIAYETADTTYRWSWDQSREAPVELSAWYEEARAFCAENAP
jgi:hypothetical protein